MSVSVRYIVNDVDAAVGFYELLDFEVKMQPGPGFAMLAGRAMPDGSVPEPGGWNRFQVEVDDLLETVDRLTAAGVRFRSDIISGQGGKQIVADDPSGNAVELFQPGPRQQ